MKNSLAKVAFLEHRRLKWLIINLIGFFIWDSLRIIDMYLLSNQSNSIMTGFMVLGWLLWIVSLIQIVRLGKIISSNKQLFKIFNDELAVLTLFKTWRLALVVVAFTQGIIIVLGSFVTEISGLLAAELSIFVLVISSIWGFFYFSSESDA